MSKNKTPIKSKSDLCLSPIYETPAPKLNFFDEYILQARAYIEQQSKNDKCCSIT